jgi:hypothetical protein
MVNYFYHWPVRNLWLAWTSETLTVDFDLWGTYGSLLWLVRHLWLITFPDDQTIGAFMVYYFDLGCPQNEKNNFSVQTETKWNKICFGFVSWNQKIIILVCFGLFRCFEPISKLPKQTELFRNGPKQPKIFCKNQNMLSIKLQRNK